MRGTLTNRSAADNGHLPLFWGRRHLGRSRDSISCESKARDLLVGA